MAADEAAQSLEHGSPFGGRECGIEHQFLHVLSRKWEGRRKAEVMWEGRGMDDAETEAEAGAWWCGGLECWEKKVRVVGGVEEKDAHVKEAHPGLPGMLFLPDRTAGSWPRVKALGAGG